MNKYRIVKTFDSAEQCEYDVFKKQSKYRCAYIVEYNNNPITNEKLENAVFDIYYDYDKENDEFVGSSQCDSIEECLEYLA